MEIADFTHYYSHLVHIGATALMPSNTTETRTLLIQILQKRRRDIEASHAAAMGAEIAGIYLCKDLLNSQARHAEEGVTFTDLCKSIEKSGLSGHWLGAGL